MNIIQFPTLDSNNKMEYESLTAYEKNRLATWINESVKPHVTKNYNMNHGSYSLKGLFERSGEGFYITNGQMKGALLAAGIKPRKADAKNWELKLSKKAGM